jgi:hypothetical protein
MQVSLVERHVASGLTPIASPYVREAAGTIDITRVPTCLSCGLLRLSYPLDLVGQEYSAFTSSAKRFVAEI